MSHELLVAIMFWRIGWYGYLLFHSIKVRVWRDAVLAVLLLLLGAVVQHGASSHLAIAAFLVAPLLTLSIVSYQKRQF
jgi:hypothetical protein